MIGDVDIDVVDRQALLSLIDYIPAMVLKGNEPTLHPSGIYLQEIPIDPITGAAAFDYTTAERKGYFKIDILNASVYEGVRDEAHLVELIQTPPPWKLLHREDFVDNKNIWHLSHHGRLVASMKPTSIEELAMTLAVIRPAKSHLRNKNWEEISREVWSKPEQNSLYYFKRSHAISYAMAIIVQINLMIQHRPELLTEYGVA